MRDDDDVLIRYNHFLLQLVTYQHVPKLFSLFSVMFKVVDKVGSVESSAEEVFIDCV
jgi:hypothetical protein